MGEGKSENTCDMPGTKKRSHKTMALLFLPPLNGLGPLSAGFIIFCCLKVSGVRWTGRDPRGSEDGAELGEPPAHSGLREPGEAGGLILCTRRTPCSCTVLKPCPSSPDLFLPRRSLAWTRPYLSSTLHSQGHLGPFFPIAIVTLFYLLVTVSLIFLFFSNLSLSFLILFFILCYCSAPFYFLAAPRDLHNLGSCA